MDVDRVSSDDSERGWPPFSKDRYLCCFSRVPFRNRGGSVVGAVRRNRPVAIDRVLSCDATVLASRVISRDDYAAGTH